MPKDKNVLIYALDADGLAEAKDWVRRLAGVAGIFKIGFQLFLREGPQAAQMVHHEGAKVFLDLKFHDIPHTVSLAAAEAVKMGAFMFNVHAGGGRAMMAAAREGAERACERLKAPMPLILGVTVLTSLDEKAVKEIGFPQKPADLVLRLAGMAQAAGLSGVVASAEEAARIRKECGPDFVIVCPGVRPAGEAKRDQARVATPGAAIKAGADYLVVGRPIREAKDPVAAAQAILAEAISAG